MSNMQTICRAIAAKGHKFAWHQPDWEQPGTRIVDPETGAAWRFTTWASIFDNSAAREIDCTAAGYAARQRARAEGPDPTDICTLNGLLGDKGQVRFDDGDGGGDWQAYIDGYEASADTRAEAILRAYAASKGVTCI